MCLLITQTNNSPALSDDWLADFYSYNSDGVGVMYEQAGSLIVEKILPTSADDFVHFYRNHIQGKNCAFHLRMRTHGDTDLTNCHPYEVLNQQEHGVDMWLMHNGILSTGNAGDTSKSDTWHYIRDYLRPMLAGNPAFAFTPEFRHLIGSHIGSGNKFVLMDNFGNMSTVNQKSGVYWAGLWLSNEYAWTASDTTSQTPIKSIKTAKKQAKEKPAPAIRYPSLSGSMYGSAYQSGFDYPSLYDDIEMILDDLGYCGHYEASQQSLRDIEGFIDDFGFNAFADIADLLMQNQIDYEQFDKALTNPDYAKENFNLKKITYKGAYYA
jgi:hypothetical protein